MSNGALAQSFLIVGAGVGIFLFFQKVFDFVEGHVSKAIVEAVKQWIVSLNFAQTETAWPKTFAQFFGKVFGKYHWSAHSAIASSTATVCAIVLTRATLVLIGAQQYTMWHESAIVVTSILINVLPDYLGLLQTRYAIRWMQARRFPFVIVIVDALIKGVFVLALLKYTPILTSMTKSNQQI